MCKIFVNFLIGLVHTFSALPKEILELESVKLGIGLITTLLIVIYMYHYYRQGSEYMQLVSQQSPDCGQTAVMTELASLVQNASHCRPFIPSQFQPSTQWVQIKPYP